MILKDMDHRRSYLRRNADNENVEPKVLIYPLGEQVTRIKFRANFQVLAQAMITQANREVIAPVSPNVGMTVTRIRNFRRKNPSEFHNSKTDEDPQEFIDEVHKIVCIMVFSTVEKGELTTYQLKDVAKVWFNQWKEEMVVDAGPLDWNKFKGVFLDSFFPFEMREAKILRNWRRRSNLLT
ncbi:hypothetical protein RDI58_022423 [Solanum bulbocastanum]|uniref:Gag-pol polyprotein n=1 Tax=Solanum bulbocastanum TaxID=147425 RepID=A0AAN8T2N0_SOLBU